MPAAKETVKRCYALKVPRFQEPLRAFHGHLNQLARMLMIAFAEAVGWLAADERRQELLSEIGPALLANFSGHLRRKALSDYMFHMVLRGARSKDALFGIAGEKKEFGSLSSELTKLIEAYDKVLGQLQAKEAGARQDDPKTPVNPLIAVGSFRFPNHSDPVFLFRHEKVLSSTKVTERRGCGPPVATDGNNGRIVLLRISKIISRKGCSQSASFRQLF